MKILYKIAHPWKLKGMSIQLQGYGTLLFSFRLLVIGEERERECPAFEKQKRVLVVVGYSGSCSCCYCCLILKNSRVEFRP